MLVKDATQQMIEKCIYIGEFTASDMGGVDVDQRLINVKVKVKNQSGKAGVTHILWGPITMSGLLSNVPVITAQGYKCSN
jgi:hypothetical protein